GDHAPRPRAGRANHLAGSGPGAPHSTGMPDIGSVSWVDLTVSNAEEVRDFYREVVGWSSEDLDMGEYADYVMRSPATGEAVAGVCHARGVNAHLPAQWLVYLTVADLEASVEKVK